MVSIVTPWKDAVDLIPDYEAAVAGAEVIVVDNASTPQVAEELATMVGRLGGKLFVNGENRWFSPANNQGLRLATGDVICFLNSDVSGGSAWLKEVARDVEDGAIYGPDMEVREVGGRCLPFLSGWCVAATRRTWQSLGGWDEALFPRPYWEDNDLSFRAMRLGLPLVRTAWSIHHKRNRTAKNVEGASNASYRNREAFAARVVAALTATEASTG